MTTEHLTHHPIERSLHEDDYIELVRMALAEDVGEGDITTAATVPAGAQGVAKIIQKGDGVVFGHVAAAAAFRELDPAVSYTTECEQGVWHNGADRIVVATITGPLAAILTGERTALNFLAHLSGIATAAARAVTALEGTKTQVLDTRKTTPGMRMLEKSAVAAGGGVNHRIGLFDAVLIKENHIAAAGSVEAAVGSCAGVSSIEVECCSLDEIDQALKAGATQLLLDNMSPEQLSEAVSHVNGRALTEASGGYTIENIRTAAEAGVDFVSLGSITHSAPALDLSLLVESA